MVLSFEGFLREQQARVEAVLNGVEERRRRMRLLDNPYIRLHDCDVDIRPEPLADLPHPPTEDEWRDLGRPEELGVEEQERNE